MINLFRFLLRNSSFFLFLAFELFALYLVVNFNQTQQSIYINASNRISGTLLEKQDQISDYFNLESINESLNRENTYLLNKLQSGRFGLNKNNTSSHTFHDAKVISNQIDGRYNRFLVNKGRASGFKNGMGVTSGQFPVGIIYQCTNRYCSAISLLNINLNLSTKIKGKNYFGMLIWQPVNPRISVLEHIPAYAEVSVGDTVVTSGYSTVFPPDLPVGIVEHVRTPKGSNSHEIDVALFVDMGRLDHVQVIENTHQPELDSLLKVSE